MFKHIQYLMYLILIKYFYYFYFLKKNKKFKFFILVDLIFFLMKKYFKLLILKKKLIKYKNILKKSLSKINLQLKNTNLDKSVISLKISRQLYFLNKLDNFLKNKLSGFNDFIINFLPTQLLPLGNRKKFYNLINKKFKRFFILIKKKLNKKFFFFYLVQMFRKIKFLFIKSDAFLNKKTFLFEFFSNISLESKYLPLLQYYRQHNKKDSFLKNKFLSFFNLIFFFLYRVDFFLYKSFSFFSLSYVRSVIFNIGIYVNNKLVNTTHYFLNKYDLLKLPPFFINNYKKLYIFCLKYYFQFINKYSYKHINDIKIKYYNSLYQIINSIDFKNRTYLTNINKILINSKLDTYLIMMENIFYFFLKNKKYNSNYNFDLLNKYKENYHVEFKFPFFLKEKKKDLFFNTNVSNLGNVSYVIKNTNVNTKNNIFNLSYLNNFIHLFFFLSKYKLFYFYVKNNKMIVSPNIINSLFKEQKKLFYYFSVLYNINFIKLI